MEAPVFIVGPPRSGTTLLAAMIGAHPEIACGAESHFFAKLSEAALYSAVKDSCWPDRAVRALSQLTVGDMPVHLQFGLSVDDLAEYLTDRAPAKRTMLEALTAQYAAYRGKKRWAEKSPPHLAQIPRIRSTFPNARIVRIVRDPRDSAESMCSLPWTSSFPVANAIVINEWFQLSQQADCTMPDTLTIRFEDLLQSPEETLRSVCQHIGVTYQPCMLHTCNADEAVVPDHEPWKKRVSQSLDPSRACAWKQTGWTRETVAISNVCHDLIETMGYESGPVGNGRAVCVNVNSMYQEFGAEAIVHLSERNIRVHCDQTPGGAHETWGEELVLLGGWRGTSAGRAAKVLEALRTLAMVVWRGIAGKATVRIPRYWTAQGTLDRYNACRMLICRLTRELYEAENGKENN